MLVSLFWGIYFILFIWQIINIEFFLFLYYFFRRDYRLWRIVVFLLGWGGVEHSCLFMKKQEILFTITWIYYLLYLYFNKIRNLKKIRNKIRLCWEHIIRCLNSFEKSSYILTNKVSFIRTIFFVFDFLNIS